ncbi:unnamed protein product [Porites lobata]|uniref:Uncharacterized protein n=1 Tax=Porites lobata TaxID=104759 RepID=A0ABN8QB55_9CNID|nr:unnamed protein product [Porites lobata]
MARLLWVILLYFVILEDSHQLMLRDQSPSNNQGASIEVCFKAFSNSTVETFKSTLRNASSEGRVNLTLYNIYVVQTHVEAEQLPRKRKKLSSHRLETWQVIAIVAFVILLVMAIIIYRLHTQNSKLKCQAILMEAIPSNNPHVKSKSFSKVQDTNQIAISLSEFPYLSLCLSIQSPPSSESHYKQSNFSVDIPQLNIRSLVSNFEALFKMIGTSGPNCSENGLP